MSIEATDAGRALNRQGRARRAVPAALACLLLGGCASNVLVIGPREEPRNVELPSQAPRVSGAETAAQREHRQMLAAFGGEYRAPAVHQILTETVERLRRATDVPGAAYRLTILNSPTANAFALPHGNLYVTRGLLALINDASEVASVLAHEMAHVTTRHAIERQELESRAVLVSRVRAEVLNNPGAAQLVRDQAQVAIATFSRQQELEADQIGLRTLAKAGYDPYGAHRFLTTLGRNADLADRSAETGTARPIDFAATHPNTPERIEKALLNARQIGAPGQIESERTRWLNAINGMVYGDDAVDGFLRGRSFLHPRLGIAFTAPEGFILENSAQAVLGITANAGEALRFDAARIAADKPLDQFLAENRIEGLALSDVQTLETNGLAGATALAPGADWTFRIFAVRSGQQVFRLIMAARQFTPEIDARFFEAFRSIRKLAPGEIARARPLRINVVAAKIGDTAEGFAERNGGLDKPVERFNVINGLEPAQRLEPGRLYKAIVD